MTKEGSRYVVLHIHLAAMLRRHPLHRAEKLCWPDHRHVGRKGAGPVWLSRLVFHRCLQFATWCFRDSRSTPPRRLSSRDTIVAFRTGSCVAAELSESGTSSKCEPTWRLSTCEKDGCANAQRRPTGCPRRSKRPPAPSSTSRRADRPPTQGRQCRLACGHAFGLVCVYFYRSKNRCMYIRMYVRQEHERPWSVLAACVGGWYRSLDIVEGSSATSLAVRAACRPSLRTS